ncbi:hypothetical protein ACLI4Q_17010 [Natrialbaceae archaeon A-CW1-1]
MGLKSGSRDAGFDETETDDEQSPEPEPTEQESKPADADVDTADHQKSTSETKSTDMPDTSTESNQADQRPSMSSIPYKLRRDKVNEGREQVPYFLREEIIDAEDELQKTLEEILGEDVYKSDYREAAMVVAQRRPELVAEVLREWGYDLQSG